MLAATGDAKGLVSVAHSTLLIFALGLIQSNSLFYKEGILHTHLHIFTLLIDSVYDNRNVPNPLANEDLIGDMVAVKTSEPKHITITVHPGRSIPDFGKFGNIDTVVVELHIPDTDTVVVRNVAIDKDLGNPRIVAG